jgi:flagellar biosynthesis/type III secretory pathway protein FliH
MIGPRHPEPIPVFNIVSFREPMPFYFDERRSAERLYPPIDPAPLELEEVSLIELAVQAYADGFARGRSDGEVSVRAEVATATAQLAGAAEAVASARAVALADLEAEVVELALSVAARILRTEAESGRDLAARLARVGLSRLGDCDRLSIRLHPEDVASVERAPGILREGISLVGDPAVGRGGAVVESEFGRLDARLEVQLEEIRRSLREGVAP